MLARPAPRPAKSSILAYSAPAPMGGLNAATGMASMPNTDCLLLWNMIPGELGLRSRLGHYEHTLGLLDGTGAAVAGAGAPAWAADTSYALNALVTNGTRQYRCTTAGTSAASGGPTGTGSGIVDNTAVWAYVAVGTDTAIRTIIPFNGATPGNSKLFATTSYGIYEVTSGGSIANTAKIVFPSSAGLAGYGTFHSVVTSAGHFMAYTDEVNGYYLYKESTGSWEKVKPAATVAWSAYTAVLGDLRTNGGNNYVCITAGTSVTGPTGTGTDITDGGTAHWSYYLPLTAGTSGTTLDPANAVFCTVWKHRLWLVEKNTAKGYYLDLDAVYGPATPVSFAGKFQHGGGLRGLWSWTYDGGSGIDDRLVAVADSGDVVVYEGSDPSIPGAFELKGVWYVGGVPTGRRICTDIGGDLLLLAFTGVLPLSKLVIGNPVVDRSQYATVKVSNLFNWLAQNYGANDGWSIRLHPQDGTLLINIPSSTGAVSEQLAMSVTTRSWGRYRYSNMAFLACEAFGGKLYLGTTDGRVLINDGYVDGVTLADPENYESVEFFVLTSYQKLGSARQKRVQMIRPTVTSQGAPPNYVVKSMYRYDLTEFSGVGTTTKQTGSTFGEYTGGSDVGDAVFDSAKFDATDFISEQRVSGGANGIGPEVAIAMAGKASARTIVIGWDVFFDQGGFL